MVEPGDFGLPCRDLVGRLGAQENAEGGSQDRPAPGRSRRPLAGSAGSPAWRGIGRPLGLSPAPEQPLPASAKLDGTVVGRDRPSPHSTAGQRQSPARCGKDPPWRCKPRWLCKRGRWLLVQMAPGPAGWPGRRAAPREAAAPAQAAPAREPGAPLGQVLVPGQQEHESGAAPRLAGQSGLFLDRKREGDSPLTAPTVGRARHRRIERVELGQRALQRRRAPQALARSGAGAGFPARWG